MKVQYIFLFALIIGLGSCSSPQKLYEKGNYFKAFDSVLGDLKGGQKNRKNSVLLNKSFSKMIDVTRDKLYVIKDGYDVKELEHNFEQYDEVVKRYAKANAFLKDESDAKYDGLLTEKDDLINDAYLEGVSLMDYFSESNKKEDARIAYYHFELVEKYGIGYENIEELMEESKLAATLFYHIEVDLDSDFSYRWDINRKFDNLEGQSGFVRIFYDTGMSNADCNIELDFSRLDVDERERSNSQNFSKEIIDGYTTKTDTSGNTIQTPIYKEVQGSVRTVSITKNVYWEIDLELKHANANCDLREKRFRAGVEDKIEQYDIRGDERAIPQEYKNKLDGRLESTDDMVDDLIDELYTQVRRYLY